MESYTFHMFYWLLSHTYTCSDLDLFSTLSYDLKWPIESPVLSFDLISTYINFTLSLFQLSILFYVQFLLPTFSSWDFIGENLSTCIASVLCSFFWANYSFRRIYVCIFPSWKESMIYIFHLSCWDKMMFWLKSVFRI